MSSPINHISHLNYRYTDVTKFLAEYIDEKLETKLLSISTQKEYEALKKKAQNMHKRKLMSINHVLMNWVNQAEIPAQRKEYKEKKEPKREFAVNLNNLIAIRLDIVNIYEVNVASGYVDADIAINMEWIDDRLRFRVHPNESLAQLDNNDLTDFRVMDPKYTWTPDISVVKRYRDSVSEDKISVSVDFELGAAIWQRFMRVSGKTQ